MILGRAARGIRMLPRDPGGKRDGGDGNRAC